MNTPTNNPLQTTPYFPDFIAPEPLSLLFEYKPDKTTREINNKKAVTYHLFYPELVLESIETINEFDCSYDKIFTVSETLPTEYLDLIKSSTTARVFVAQNSGRDLYPFWLLVKQGVLDSYELICKLHGKKSLHRGDGDEWRRASIDVLCGSKQRIKYIENIFFDNTYPGLSFIAPQAKALISTQDRHWLGNLHWLKEISSRLGNELKLEDVSGKAIMAGSFYWMNSEGVNKFRQLPISLQDWADNHLIGDKTDGKLEHFVERSLLLAAPISLATSTTAGFIANNGEIRIIEGREVKSESPRESLTQQRNSRNEQIVNLNNLHFKNQATSDIKSSYTVHTTKTSTTINGFILDLCEPQKRFQVTVHRNGEPLDTLDACHTSELGNVVDVSTGDCGFHLEIPYSIPHSEITISEKNSGLQLQPDSTPDTETIESLLTLNRTTPNAFAFPEQIRQLQIPLSKYLTGTNAIKSATVKRLKTQLEDSDNREVLSDGQNVKHVLVVNNPIAEIAVARIVEKLSLTAENTLIILHRVNSTSLLGDLPTISTNLTDIEKLFSKDDLLSSFSCINNILEKIGNCTFTLYAHHYNALFSYILGMHPLCTSVNLVEEGNLSSVPNWEAQYSSKALQYTNTKALIKKDSPLTFTNSLLQLIGPSEFEFINYTILNSHFPEVISDQTTIPEKLSTLFSNNDNTLDIDQFAHMLLMKRYYLWHPKMTSKFNMFSLSKGFKGMGETQLLSTPSLRETRLQTTYKNILGEEFALILLPGITRFPLFNKLVESNKDMTEFFNGLTPSSKIFYIMHPASRVDAATKAETLEKLNEYPIFKSLKTQDLCEVLGPNPVTEIAATCFKYVVHYGSSLSIVLEQYGSQTAEVYLDTFR